MTNIITKNETELILKLSSLIEKVSNESIKERKAFYIGLSGKLLYRINLLSGQVTTQT